jgi:hypothetical protein
MRFRPLISVRFLTLGVGLCLLSWPHASAGESLAEEQPGDFLQPHTSQVVDVGNPPALFPTNPWANTFDCRDNVSLRLETSAFGLPDLFQISDPRTDSSLQASSTRPSDSEASRPIAGPTASAPASGQPASSDISVLPVVIFFVALVVMLIATAVAILRRDAARSARRW